MKARIGKNDTITRNYFIHNFLIRVSFIRFVFTLLCNNLINSSVISFARANLQGPVVFFPPS